MHDGVALEVLLIHDPVGDGDKLHVYSCRELGRELGMRKHTRRLGAARGGRTQRLVPTGLHLAALLRDGLAREELPAVFRRAAKVSLIAKGGRLHGELHVAGGVAEYGHGKLRKPHLEEAAAEGEVAGHRDVHALGKVGVDRLGDDVVDLGRLVEYGVLELNRQGELVGCVANLKPYGELHVFVERVRAVHEQELVVKAPLDNTVVRKVLHLVQYAPARLVVEHESRVVVLANVEDADVERMGHRIEEADVKDVLGVERIPFVEGDELRVWYAWLELSCGNVVALGTVQAEYAGLKVAVALPGDFERRVAGVLLGHDVPVRVFGKGRYVERKHAEIVRVALGDLAVVARGNAHVRACDGGLFV